MAQQSGKKAQLVKQLSQILLENGLQDASLRTLAKAAGTSDRMLLYYFPDKAAMMSELLTHIAEQLATQLDSAIPGDVKRSERALFEVAMPMLLAPNFKPVMWLWLDIAARAHRGRQPYVSIAKAIIAGFSDWLCVRLEGRAEDNKPRAQALLSLMDGIFLLSPTLSPKDLEAMIAAAAAGLDGAQS